MKMYGTAKLLQVDSLWTVLLDFGNMIIPKTVGGTDQCYSGLRVNVFHMLTALSNVVT